MGRNRREWQRIVADAEDLKQRVDAYYDPMDKHIYTQPGPGRIVLKNGKVPRDLFPKLYEVLDDS